MNIILALLVLSAIIIIHEFGHFILAKANGVGVTEFAVGMGPRIIKFQKGETLYCIKLLPFGGSCMMVGEDENSDDEKAFNNKSVWARISIIAAGPIFNFILAFIMAVIIVSNIGYDPCIVSRIQQDSAAMEAGIKEGDLIVAINGKKVYFSRDYSLMEMIYPDETMNITYMRNGERFSTTLTPKYMEHDYYQMGISISELEIVSVSQGMPAYEAGILQNDVIVAIDGVMMENAQQAVSAINNCGGKTICLTVLRNQEQMDIEVTPKIVHTSGYETGLSVYYGRVRTNALETIRMSFHEVGYCIRTVVESLKMMIGGKVSKDDVAGPVGVVTLIGEVVEESKSDGNFYVMLNLFNMVLMLSANLGVMNLLPLPALDGGRLVFLVIEAVRRKPIDREKEGMVHFIGIILLMLLMVFITFNDIMKLF